MGSRCGPHPMALEMLARPGVLDVEKYAIISKFCDFLSLNLHGSRQVDIAMIRVAPSLTGLVIVSDSCRGFSLLLCERYQPADTLKRNTTLWKLTPPLSTQDAGVL